MKSDGNPTPLHEFSYHRTLRQFQPSWQLLHQSHSSQAQLSNPRNSPIPMEATALKTNMEPENDGNPRWNLLLPGFHCWGFILVFRRGGLQARYNVVFLGETVTILLVVRFHTCHCVVFLLFNFCWSFFGSSPPKKALNLYNKHISKETTILMMDRSSNIKS